MAIIEFHFSKPTSLIGKLICWRTKGKFSHAWIIIDGVQYDPMPIRSKRREPPIYKSDMILYLSVSDDQYNFIRDWCEDWVGTYYDFLGIFGWLIGIKELHASNATYCFEFIHMVMEMIRGVSHKDKLISAQHVIDELILLNAVLVVNN